MQIEVAPPELPKVVGLGWRREMLFLPKRQAEVVAVELRLEVEEGRLLLGEAVGGFEPMEEVLEEQVEQLVRKHWLDHSQNNHHIRSSVERQVQAVVAKGDHQVAAGEHCCSYPAEDIRNCRHHRFLQQPMGEMTVHYRQDHHFAVTKVLEHR